MKKEERRKESLETRLERIIEANPQIYKKIKVIAQKNQKMMENFTEVSRKIFLLAERMQKEISSINLLVKLEKETDIQDKVFLQGVDNTTKEELNKLFIWASVNDILKFPIGTLPTEEQELQVLLEFKVAEKWKNWKELNIKHVGIGGVSEYSKNASKGPEVTYLNKEEKVEDLNNRWEIAHRKFSEYLDKLELTEEERTLWEVAVFRGKIKAFGDKNNNDVITRRARKNLGEDYKEFIKVFEILKRLARERQELALELTSSKVSHRVNPK